MGSCTIRILFSGIASAPAPGTPSVPHRDTLSPRYLSALGVDAPGKICLYRRRVWQPDRRPDARPPQLLRPIPLRYKKNIRSGSSLVSNRFLIHLLLPIASSLRQKPNTWYGLLFPNDSYNSALQLVEGSLTDSTFRLVGNTYRIASTIFSPLPTCTIRRLATSSLPLHFFPPPSRTRNALPQSRCIRSTIHRNLPI